ncbi:MAG TPA: 1,4-alpha-glucan branching protein GlgB [Ignavibacteria bacterium]|nr:1,4-alpha-glucan branching protein GlgB [Ignavibacteria bacterium]HMR39956.1 1,4-alpha-glucan branching protein GlgB [Ignavibacteria bacterium]
MSKKDRSDSGKVKIKKHKTNTSKKKKSDSFLSESDLKLLAGGTHFKSYEKLGARSKTIKKEKGVQFVVWAPDAKSVSVVGEFNDWEPGENKMEKAGKSGYWQAFISGLGEGEMYKFAVRNLRDEIVFKSDPYAFKTEHRPGNASIVYDFNDKYKWKDTEWINERKKLSSVNNSYKNIPISVYEVHLGSWKKDHSKNEWGYKNYRELAHELADYVLENNYTHIELLPVMEHPLDISWGYQVVNYFAPTSRYGEPEDFMYFVDHCHQKGIGVILDWVPSHFPTDEHGLGNFTGKEIYAYENMQKGFHKEWGTYVFDYGKNEVINFLISNALFWIEKYHVDGLRVDAVASMLYLDYSRDEGEWQPNIYGGNENLEAVTFIKNLNERIHKKHKGVLMIAEESSSWPGVTAPVHLGGLGFDMKWNMGWMHDILAYFSMDPVFRKFHHGKLTFAIWYAFSEKFLLPISHDEVVHLKKAVIEKMPGDEWQKFANARLLYGFMYAHPGKKLNFMGNEIAQYTEWNSEESLKWEVLKNDYNKKFNLFFRELNRLYKDYPAFHEVDFDSKGFQWLDFSDSDDSVIGFLRFNSDKSEMLLFTFNMTPVLRENYVFGVPKGGFFREVMNSNASEYGGSGVGNMGGIHSSDEPRFEFLNSIKVTLPPLAMNVYKYESAEPLVEEEINERGEVVEIIKDEADDKIDKKEEIDKPVETAEPAEPEKSEIIDEPDSSDLKKLSDNSVSEAEEVLTEETKEKPVELSEEEEMEMKLKEIVNRIKKF